MTIKAACRHAGISTHTLYRWKREAECFAFLDGLHAAGWSVDEIEAAVMAAERAAEEGRP